MKLNKKISLLTTIPKDAIDNISDYISFVHSHDICTQLKEGVEYIKLDLFEGNLYISIDSDDNVHYKFIPSEDFDKLVVNTILSKESTLVNTATAKLKSLLTNTYKDLF